MFVVQSCDSCWFVHGVQSCVFHPLKKAGPFSLYLHSHSIGTPRKIFQNCGLLKKSPEERNQGVSDVVIYTNIFRHVDETCAHPKDAIQCQIYFRRRRLDRCLSFYPHPHVG